MREEHVREVLGLDERDRLNERGVFPAGPVDELAQIPPESEVVNTDVVLGAEWLSEVDLEELFSDDRTLAAALPGGRVKRLDVDPRIVVFEALPGDARIAGSVFDAGGGTVVMDSRTGPAVLVVEAGDHEVVVLGESGDLRLFELRRSDAD